MKICPNCSFRTPDFAHECPNCSTVLGEASHEVAQSTGVSRDKKRDWVWLALGVPGMMVMLYLLYYFARQVFFG